MIGAETVSRERATEFPAIFSSPLVPAGRAGERRGAEGSGRHKACLRVIDKARKCLSSSWPVLGVGFLVTKKPKPT